MSKSAIQFCHRMERLTSISASGLNSGSGCSCKLDILSLFSLCVWFQLVVSVRFYLASSKITIYLLSTSSLRPNATYALVLKMKMKTMLVDEAKMKQNTMLVEQ